MKTMPCPHCGSADTEADADAYEGVVAAKCNSCGTCGPYVRFKLTRHCTCCLPDHDPVEVDEAKADAIRAWNRLALATSIAEALEWRDECQGTARLVWDTWGFLAVFKSIEEMDANIKSANEELRRMLDQWAAMESIE